jgi:hypothetical protein
LAPALAPTPSEAQRTLAFLEQNTARYHAALLRARGWLDRLVVDPVELRKQGIKGKKKLVEIIDAYVRLRAIATPEEREPLSLRLRELAAITERPGYHDMLEVDDLTFKQDATSYLRAAFLLDRSGLDVGRYRVEIGRIQPRLDAHMHGRGSHQRMAFHDYYRHFGLKPPFDLASGFRAGVIASRKSPYEYKRTLDIYALTHEIFVPYEFGEKLDADFFSPDDKQYLRHALDRLTVAQIMVDNPDLVAELVSCLRYLHFTDLPVYREALDYLLKVQRPDGTWGDYERYRARLGSYVDQGYTLHTTVVAIDALSVAFHFREL